MSVSKSCICSVSRTPLRLSSQFPSVFLTVANVRPTADDAVLLPIGNQFRASRLCLIGGLLSQPFLKILRQGEALHHRFGTQSLYHIVRQFNRDTHAVPQCT